MNEIAVHSRTQQIQVLSNMQRIVVSQNRTAGVIGVGLTIVDAGPVGPVGLRGLPGVSSGSYVHTQTFPLLVWLITHNLGYRPAGIKAFELVAPDTYVDVEGAVLYISENAFTIGFDTAISGLVYVS
jgi:hypothetical protein